MSLWSNIDAGDLIFAPFLSLDYCPVRLVMKNKASNITKMMVISIFLVSCASQDLQVLQEKNKSLEQELSSANSEIRQLKQQETRLRERIGELTQTASVLTTEKTSRVAESSTLRSQVRKFVQDNIDDLKTFMVQGNLLDYVGSELVSRAKIDTRPILIIDFAHPMPNTGILTGIGGYFSKAGSLAVKVLHPVGDQYVITWESKELEIAAPGRQLVQFPVSVGVEKGDVIGYVFLREPSVSFDTSTGDTLYVLEDVALGSTMKKTSMSGAEEKRAYSLGVFGLLGE